jgi:hypothetical protein
MLIYVEACESGSMFNNVLPGDISVYAVTAATPFESSWACYYNQVGWVECSLCVRACLLACAQTIGGQNMQIEGAWWTHVLFIKSHHLA